MSPKNETAGDLREQKKAVELRIGELITLRDSLSVVITHVEGTGVQLPFETILDAPNNGIGLTAFIRGLFQSNPDKKWTIKAIRAEVKAGNVAFGGQHLNESIYSVLSRLVRRKEIKKGGLYGKQRWYKKIESVKV